ncbi:hypothetical protein [Chromatium okenii]|uniref:hypothetical protein n=1 Tax=Chromatium okenii TaxID=61644 RepID=UPI001A914411|nr:hypothetical protein [Chromatium okenii]
MQTLDQKKHCEQSHHQVAAQPEDIYHWLLKLMPNAEFCHLVESTLALDVE